MSRRAVGQDRSGVTVVDIDDPTDGNAGVEFLDLDAVQLQSQPMHVRRVVVRLESAAVIYQSTTLRIRTRTSIREGLIGYLMFGPRVRGTVNGLVTRPDLMLAAAPGKENLLVTGGDWESVTLLVPPDDMRAHLVARGRECEFHLPTGTEPLQVDVDRVRVLFDWAKRLVETAEQRPTLFDEPSKERVAAQHELLEMLLSTLRVADDFESTRSDRTRQAHSQIVRIAEEYCLAHTDERIHVTDLCKAASVSERTLEYAFREITGLTPMAYLVRLRLHRVRQALLGADPDSTTVSVEALNWGFWHFGEFAGAYKECFGELPSETLRRNP